MKKILLFIISIFVLASCTQESEIISIENLQKVKNTITTTPSIYSQTTKVTFHNEKDIEKFKSDLDLINKEIKSNTWSLTFNQIMDKAKLLDYLWNTGEALELYEENFSINGHSESIPYNHNLAKLYEKLWEDKKALDRYEFLIKYFGRNDYLKDIAKIFKKQWNEVKYEQSMTLYNKYKKSTDTEWLEMKDINIDTNWSLQLN